MQEVYALRFTRADFDRIPEQERLVHLVLGQLANDVNLLQKQLLFAMSGLGEGGEPQHHASAALTLLMERLLAGRLNEAYEFISSAECNRTMQSYDDVLPEEWRDARRDLNAYFNSDNVLRRLRNKVAFHINMNVTREAYATVPEDEPMVDFITEYQGECLWGSSDVVAGFAMIALAGGAADIPKAMLQIANDVIQAAKLFSIYIKHAQVAVIERHFPDAQPSLPPFAVEGPGLLDVRIPFFCTKPTPQQMAARLAQEAPL